MELDLAINDAVLGVTKKWAKQRKAEERSRRSARSRADAFRYSRYTIRQAAFDVMEKAYMKASGSGRFPANARQIMYAARPEILDRTGESELNDAYFTQRLLPDYIEATGATWDVVFDARGNFTEPHTTTNVPLGTLAVRSYLGQVAAHKVNEPSLSPSGNAYPTKGPTNRFGAILFIEKEGFGEILAAAGIASRFDVAIMSTKGMSVTASRLLVDQLQVPLFVLHDFDQAGFAILGSLRRSTRRYYFRFGGQVTDLGLTLADIEHYGLGAEYQRLTHGVDVLRRNGASAADIAFLREGQRVELNMLSSDEFVEMIETKLTDLGIKKVIPSTDVLESAYRRAYQVALLNRAVSRAAAQARRRAARASIPSDLEARLRAVIEEDATSPWDEAVARIVSKILVNEP